MKVFLIAFLGLIGVVVLIGLGLLTRVLFFPVNTAEKLIDTAYDSQAKTLNADNATYNYEWFKQTKEDIEAKKRQYDNACISADSFKESAGDRATWTFEDKGESSRLESIKLGLANSLEQTIADYNARASMANRNIFINSIVPNYIDALTYVKR